MTLVGKDLKGKLIYKEVKDVCDYEELIGKPVDEAKRWKCDIEKRFDKKNWY